MQSIGETEILIETTIVGKVRVQSVSALDALRPRIGLLTGVDLNPIHGSLHSGQPPPDQYWLTDLGGDLRLHDKGPSIGTVQWIGMRREVRALPYPSESQLQLACDLDPWTLERLERHRDGQDLTLWIELWPRLEHPGGYLSASIRGFRLSVPRSDWLRFLEDAGYGTYELLEIRIPNGNKNLAHRAIDGVRDAQRRLWAGDHAGALTECRKAIEALEALAPSRDLAAHLGRVHDSRRGKLYSGISSRLKELASLAVHDYGREASFSRTEIGFLIRTTASLAALVLESTSNDPED